MDQGQKGVDLITSIVLCVLCSNGVHCARGCMYTKYPGNIVHVVPSRVFVIHREMQVAIPNFHTYCTCTCTLWYMYMGAYSR